MILSILFISRSQRVFISPFSNSSPFLDLPTSFKNLWFPLPNQFLNCLALRYFLGYHFLNISVVDNLVGHEVPLGGWRSDIWYLILMGKHICISWKNFCYWYFSRPFYLILRKICIRKEKCCQKNFFGHPYRSKARKHL